MINTRASSWQEARWPYPRPGAIRRDCIGRDAQGRCYMPVSAADRAALGARRHRNWYWCALPATSDTPVAPLEVGDRPRVGGAPHRVRDVLINVLPRRKIQVVAMSKLY